LVHTARVAIRLALVEDHAALREGLELLLARSGCEVIGSADGEETGFALVSSSDPDVVVVDVTLADGDGITLTRRLLEARTDRGVVIYTGSSDEEHLLDGLDSGARGYALKEGSIEELLEAIRVVAGGGSYVDPRLAPALLSPKATQRQPSLSAREREIMSLLAEGLTGEEVADRLFLSAETVKTHVRNAMSKLEARNRVHAIAIALRQGEIDLPEEQGAST
jgi:DNA-binding NarL/FixJ family response regulator